MRVFEKVTSQSSAWNRTRVMLLRGSSRLTTSRAFAVRRSSTIADPAKYNSFGSPKNPKIKEARPLSPHVTIYKMPLPAVTSIVHRITGVGMVAGTLLLAVRDLCFYDNSSNP